jgi:endonuclease/exonuclease/phosphatase (EEP) superfamily protein YafD
MPERFSRVVARAFDVLLPVVTGALLFAAFIRLVAPQVNSEAILLTGLTPWAFLPAYPVAIACAVARRWLLVGLCLVVVVAHACWVAPELFDTKPIPRGTHVRVATANLYEDNNRRGQLGPALLAVGADVLVLEELTPSILDRLRSEGLVAAYRYRFLLPDRSPQGIGLFSKYPIADPTAVPLGPATGLHVTLVVAGARIDFWGLHTHAPLRGEGRGLWDAEFREFRATVAPGNGTTIVAGDFNATMQFPTLRSFARHAHLVEANQARGQGLASTWPANKPFPPLLRLDHVFVRHLGVSNVSEFHVPGSDHRGIVAGIVVPDG